MLNNPCTFLAWSMTFCLIAGETRLGCRFSCYRITRWHCTVRIHCLTRYLPHFPLRTSNGSRGLPSKQRFHHQNYHEINSSVHSQPRTCSFWSIFCFHGQHNYYQATIVINFGVLAKRTCHNQIDTSFVPLMIIGEVYIRFMQC